MPARDQITLGILAGGRGSRLGGADKACAVFQGQTLLVRTLAALGEGFTEVLLSYNGNRADLGNLPVRVVADLRGDFPGPLAGLEALLQATSTDWLLSVPIDLRDIPADFPERLLGESGGRQSMQGSVLFDSDGLQPLVALWPVAAARLVTRLALDAGHRAVHPVVQSLGLQVRDISPQRLGNLNTPADFE